MLANQSPYTTLSLSTDVIRQAIDPEGDTIPGIRYPYFPINGYETVITPPDMNGVYMRPVRFDDAETYEPEAGWRRVSMAGSEKFTFEYFEKPPGHSSPMHSHENEQVCLCLDGEMSVYTEDDSIRLQQYDSVFLESEEPHRVENEGDEPAVGLDVFAPGRSFDFWTDHEK